MDTHTYYFVTTSNYNNGVHSLSHISAILQLKDMSLIDRFKSICDDNLHCFESLDESLSFIEETDNFPF